MNTAGDPKSHPEAPEKSLDAGKISFPVSGEIQKSEQQIGELQEQIQDGKDRYLELSFVFIIFAVIVLDFFIFKEINTAIGIIFICFLELIALLILCKRFGIEEPYVFLVAMLKRLTNAVGKGDGG